MTNYEDDAREEWYETIKKPRIAQSLRNAILDEFVSSVDLSNRLRDSSRYRDRNYAYDADGYIIHNGFAVGRRSASDLLSDILLHWLGQLSYEDAGDLGAEFDLNQTWDDFYETYRRQHDDSGPDEDRAYDEQQDQRAYLADEPAHR